MSTIKKAGIVTLVDYSNYGNRLQNYALVCVLREMGIESRSGLFVVSREDMLRKSMYIDSKLIIFIKKIIPWKLYIKYAKYNQQKEDDTRDELLKKRIKKFKKFTNNYTEEFSTLYARDAAELKELLNDSEYQYWITGSDQVWNPTFSGDDYFFLTFTDYRKRYSYAASIGVSEIPFQQKDRYAARIRDMKYLSVREEGAAKLVKDLTGQEADVSVDPTLLLEVKEWKSLEKMPDISLPSEYICAYFLGEIPNSIKQFSQEKELPIIFLNDKKYSDLYVLDPAEFIYVLEHSRYIFTDSFHAVVFSIIFEKNFYVFQRKQKDIEGMFERIHSITKRFSLENRIMNREVFHAIPDIQKQQWEVIRTKLSQERLECRNKLRRALFEEDFFQGNNTGEL